MTPAIHTRTALGLILLLTAPAIAFADSVAGHFQHDDRRAEFSHGIAVRWSDPQAPGGRSLVVLLADAPLDAERGRGKGNPIGNIEAALPFDSVRLHLHVDGPDAAPALHRFSFDGFMALSPGGDELQLRDGRLVGTWRVPEMTEGSGSRWQTDLQFDLPLIDLDAGR